MALALLAALALVTASSESEAARGSNKPVIIYAQGMVLHGRDTVNVCVRGAGIVRVNGGRGALAGACKNGGTVYRRQFENHKPTRTVKIAASVTKKSPEVTLIQCLPFGKRPSQSC